MTGQSEQNNLTNIDKTLQQQLKKRIELSEQNEQITLSHSSVKTHKCFKIGLNKVNRKNKRIKLIQVNIYRQWRKRTELCEQNV